MRTASTFTIVISLTMLGVECTPPVRQQPAEQENARAIERNDQQYGKANPKAPPELSRFAFLIGAWRGDAKLKREDGSWQSLEATWRGRYILDGYAIADEYRMTTPAGELLVLGVNLRAYDSKTKAWNMKWLNALGGSWVDLGPEELGGVRADEQAVSYLMREPVAEHAWTRATYTNISETHFTWRGERSSDATMWEEIWSLNSIAVQADNSVARLRRRGVSCLDLVVQAWTDGSWRRAALGHGRRRSPLRQTSRRMSA